MALGKWIGGFLGFIVTGSPLGALAGYVIGKMFENNDPSNNNGYFESDNQQAYGQQHYGSQAGAGYQQSDRQNGDRNAFLFSLLVLASYIIKADGKVMHSEMNLVRDWLRTNFGEEAREEGEQILLRLFDQQKRLGPAEYRSAVMSSCLQIRQYMSYEQRLQLLSFLVMIAQADGQMLDVELRALRECALQLGLSETDLDSMLHLRDAGTNLDAAYRVLGVSPDATDQEVKAAYRRLALQNHPDRVATLGEDVRRAAEKKLQDINAAKETVWKARGL